MLLGLEGRSEFVFLSFFFVKGVSLDGGRNGLGMAQICGETPRPVFLVFVATQAFLIFSLQVISKLFHRDLLLT
jgi:hypothetical protein